MTWVFCAGMIRSGSTLQYQLASSIVEHSGLGHRVKYAPESEFEMVLDRHTNDTGLKVFKAHVCTGKLYDLAKSGQAKVIYSYRDIRDVAVSAMKKFDKSFDELVNAGWLDQAITDYYAWTNMPHVLVSRYEEMNSNLTQELSRIAVCLGLIVNTETLSKLAEQYDIPAQLQRIDALKRRYGQRTDESDIVFDEDELLHHNHIHKGEVGGWKNQLTPLQQHYLTGRYSQWLLSLGYDVEH